MNNADSKTRTAAALQHKSSEQSPDHTGERAGLFGAEKQPSFFPAPIQAKLTVNKPGDSYEQEADKVADQVVQRLAENQTGPTPAESGKNGEKPVIQRLPITPIQRSALSAAAPTVIQAKCAACEGEEKLQKKDEEEPEVQSKIQRKPIFDSAAEPPDEGQGSGSIQRKPIFESAGQVEEGPVQRREMPSAGNWGTVQMKCAACAAEEKEPVQRSESGDATPAPSNDFGSRLQSSKGGGSPLPADVSSSMGEAMGADLSNVRVHTGSEAAGMSNSIQAQAFTHGSDVYFNEGKYSPGSGEGKKLLAHELVHTVQQGGQNQIQRQVSSRVETYSNCSSAQQEMIHNHLQFAKQWVIGAIDKLLLLFSRSMSRNEISAVARAYEANFGVPTHDESILANLQTIYTKLETVLAGLTRQIEYRCVVSRDPNTFAETAIPLPNEIDFPLLRINAINIRTPWFSADYYTRVTILIHEIVHTDLNFRGDTYEGGSRYSQLSWSQSRVNADSYAVFVRQLFHLDRDSMGPGTTRSRPTITVDPTSTTIQQKNKTDEVAKENTNENNYDDKFSQKNDHKDLPNLSVGENDLKNSPDNKQENTKSNVEANNEENGLPKSGNKNASKKDETIKNESEAQNEEKPKTESDQIVAQPEPKQPIAQDGESKKGADDTGSVEAQTAINQWKGKALNDKSSIEKDDSTKTELMPPVDATPIGTTVAEGMAAPMPSPEVAPLPNAGESATEIKTWKRNIGKTIGNITAPAIHTAASAAANIEGKGKEISNHKKANQPDYLKDLETKLPNTPDLGKEPEVELSPIEKEVKALLGPASNKPLLEHVIPPLNPTPSGYVPRLGDKAQLVALDSEIKTLQASIEKLKKEGASADTISENELKLKMLQQISSKALPESVPNGQPATITIKDEGEPPRKKLPAAMMADVGSVIAQLLANPHGNAETMISDMRKKAFPNQILDIVYPTLGNEETEVLTQILESELKAIATDAGVSDEELKAKVAAQTAKLEEEKKNAETQMSIALPIQKENLEIVCKDETAAISGTREAADKKSEQQMEAVNGANDPQLIKQKAARIRKDTDTQVGEQRVFYDRSLERRNGQLDKVLSDYVQAYQAAAMREEQKLNENKTDSSNNLVGADTRNWKDAQVREITAEIVKLKRTDKKNTDDFKKAIQDAGTNAADRIETWEREQTGTQKSWWERLIETVTSWFTQTQAESKAWEQVNVQKSRDALVSDLGFLDDARKQLGDNVSEEAIMGNQRISEEQKAILLAYYGKGPDAGNSIAAVAAGMRMRLRKQHEPQMTEKFYELIEAKPASEWEDINEIARAVTPGFSADKNRNELRQAMKGWGTNEGRVYDALTGLSKIQRIAVEKCYEDSHGSLKEDIEDDFSGDEQDRALALLEGKTAEADAAALKYAMDGGFMFGAGTDEDVIMKTLRGKSEEERQAIIEAYRVQYGEDLNLALEDELSSHDLEMANALVVGDTALADAIGLDQAMNGGWTGAGTHEEAIDKTYQQIRKEVEAEAAKNKWTTAQMEAEISKRNQNVESSFNKKYGSNYDLKPGQSALREEFKDELSGAELNLANALADNDLIKADAARIAVEKESFFYADDDKINDVLQGQYNRALSELKRDSQDKLEQELDRRQKEAEGKGEKWDRYKVAEERRRLDAELEQQARKTASGYMNQLEKTYDNTYRGFSGGLRLDLAMNTSGYSQDKALTLLDQGGYLSPVQEVEFATLGAGTNEEKLKKLFDGKTQEEIKKIEDEWNTKHPGESLKDRINSELSGRDEFDTQMSMRGLPKDIHQDMKNMRDRHNWEINNTQGAKFMSFVIGGTLGGGSGLLFGDAIYQNFLGGEEEAILRDRMAFLEKQYEIINNPKLGDKRDNALADLLFQQGTQNLDVAIKGYREQIDAATNGVATIAAITAAVIVGVVLTIVTGGAAAPGVAAAITSISGTLGVSTTAVIAGASALAGLAAQVATKQIMLGSAYGDEDIMYDLGVGAVDVVAAMATAGVGPAVLKKFGLDSIEHLAKDPKLANRIIAHFITEGTEGVVGSVPSALTGNILNDQNWSGGNPALNILKGTAIEVGISGVASGGMGTIGAIGDPNLGKNVPSDSPVHHVDSDAPHIVDIEGKPYHESLKDNPSGLVDTEGKPLKDSLDNNPSRLTDKEGNPLKDSVKDNPSGLVDTEGNPMKDSLENNPSRLTDTEGKPLKGSVEENPSGLKDIDENPLSPSPSGLIDVNGMPLVGEKTSASGHNVKVLKDGSIVRCTTCAKLQDRFQVELENPKNEALAARLEEIKAMPNGQAKAAAAANLEADLMKVKESGEVSHKRWDDPTLTREEMIADYRAENPKSGLDDEDIGLYYDQDFRVNPETGAFKRPIEAVSGKPRAKLPEPGSAAHTKWMEYLRTGKGEPCFPPSTIVKTTYGNRRIEELRTGDLVYSHDDIGKIIVPRSVLNCFENWAMELVEIHTSNADVIEATLNHPFWIENEGKYCRADSLQPGSLLRTSEGGLNTIVKVSIKLAQVVTYNIEVEENHNYFVGETGVLVHNEDVEDANASRFADTNAYPSYIYVITDPRTGTVIYVGQTIQDVEVRLKKHLTDPKSAVFQYLMANGHPDLSTNPNKFADYDLREVLDWITPSPSGEMLTPYELSVWEQHYLDEYGGLDGLENKIKAITDEKMLMYRNLHNPCG